ncbi:MAG: hypothetical protein L3J39_10990 [Verrucomicrobiales bacterium]|nr:hypothetical protein [Verrucomicrobiales bacterium]
MHKFIIIITLLLGGANVFAWGPGHDDQTEEILKHLPAQLKTELTSKIKEKTIKEYSHYPDSFKPFDVEIIGEEALLYLKVNKIAKRYDLHSDKGRAFCFILLCRAIRNDEFERAFFWLACLGHSSGDMSACNHDPLIHIATYDWKELPPPHAKAMKDLMPSLDLHWTANSKRGKSIYESTVKQFLSATQKHESIDEALLQIMMYGHAGARYTVARGSDILSAAFNASSDQKSRKKLYGSMSEIAAWATVRTIRDAKFAVRLKTAKTAPEWTEKIKQEHKELMTEAVQTANIKNDSLFKNILTEDYKGIGVVLEPTWRMNEAALGFSSRYVAAALCERLKKERREYCTIDVRKIATTDKFKLSPKKIPVIIVIAANYQSYHSIRSPVISEKLSKYIRAGGKVIWVGGKTKPPEFILDKLGGSIHSASKLRWPLEVEKFIKGEIYFSNMEKSYTFFRNPKTQAGWHRPECPYTFTGNKPLLIYKSPNLDEDLVIAAISRKVAFLPIYSLHPYLLGDPALIDLQSVSLDNPGWDIISYTLDQLEIGK